MALPLSLGTTSLIPNGSRAGPFKVGSAWYFVSYDGSGTSDDPMVFKATDPTSSFTEQDSSNRPSVPNGELEGLAAVVDGTLIHIVYVEGNGVGNADLDYSTFNTSTDAWATVDESIIAAGLQESFGANKILGIGVRSDGDVLVLYQGDNESVMGSNYDRAYLARRESSSWTVDIRVDNQGKTENNIYSVSGLMVDQTNDRFAAFYTLGTQDLRHSHYLSGNTFGQQDAQIDVSVTAMPSAAQRQVVQAYSFDNSGSKIRIGFRDGNGTTDVGNANDANAPSWAADIEDIFGTGSTKSAAFGVDGTTQWAVYNLDASGGTIRVKSTGAGNDTWGSPTTHDSTVGSGTVIKDANVYTRSGATVLGFIYDDGGTYYYDEYEIDPGAVDFDVNTLAYTLSLNDVDTRENFDTDALSYSLTLNDIDTRENFDLDSLSYTLTLQTIDIIADIDFDLDTLSFSLTLQDIDTRENFDLDSLSYALTLNDIDFVANVDLDSLSFALTLNDIDTRENFDLDQLSFALTLNDIDLRANVDLDSLSYSLSLQDIDTRENFDLDTLSFATQLLPIDALENFDPDILGYALTLNDLAIVQLGLDTLTFATTLQDIDTRENFDLDSLAYALTLQDIDLRANVDLDTLSFSLTLQDVDLRENFDLDALAFSTALQDIDTRENFDLDALTFSLTLQDVQIVADIDFDLDTLAFSLALQDIDLRENFDLDALSFSLTLNDIDLRANFDADTLAYALTLQDVQIVADIDFDLDTLGYALTLQTADIRENFDLDALAFSTTLEDVDTRENFDLDAPGYAVVLQDLDIVTEINFDLDTLGFALTLNDVDIITEVNVDLDTLAYATTLQSIALGEQFELDTLDYSLLLNDALTDNLRGEYANIDRGAGRLFERTLNRNFDRIWEDIQALDARLKELE